MKMIRISMTAMAAMLAAQAMALTPGQAPSNGTLINPFTGTDTPVWRLVGVIGGGCTATQLTRDFVQTARHCGIQNGALFFNDLSISGQSSEVVDCMDAPQADWTLCRLKNPERFSPGAYPVLAPMPLKETMSSGGSVLSWGRNLAIGQFLSMGYRFPPNVAAYLDGAFARNGMNHAFPVAEMLSQFSGVGFDSGDSGGPLFWIAPNGNVAWVGSNSTQYGVPIGVTISTVTDLDWIVSRISALGYSVPTVVTPEQHYGGTIPVPPPSLKSPINVVVNGLSATVSWVPPALAAGQTVSGYSVAFGQGAVPSQVVSVSGAQSVSTTQAGLQLGKQSVCVIPYNASVGLASRSSMNQSLNPEYDCVSFDTRAPNSVTTLSLTSTVLSSTLRKVTASWAAPAPSEVVVGSYKVQSTVSYAGGASRTSVQEVKGLNLAISASKGNTVCVSVTALSVNKVPATSAASQCIVAN